MLLVKSLNIDPNDLLHSLCHANHAKNDRVPTRHRHTIPTFVLAAPLFGGSWFVVDEAPLVRAEVIVESGVVLSVGAAVCFAS